MKTKIVSLALFILMTVLWALPELSEARRMGGGKSFGSRPQYNQSTPSPSMPSQGMSPSPQSGAFNQSGRRPGLFGGLGGMLGGMLMGGLIGSLLFGGGFTGPGLLDLLLVGGGLFLLFRVLKARKMASQTVPPAFERTGGYTGYDNAASGYTPSLADRPADFDEREFLEGARTAYIRLQSSWDKRDLADIRQFTSPEVWEELRLEAEKDPTPGKTEIVYVNASVTKVEKLEGDMVVSVLFDALLRESPQQAQPESVKEIWHFSRKASDPNSFWRLEGLQQVED